MIDTEGFSFLYMALSAMCMIASALMMVLCRCYLKEAQRLHDSSSVMLDRIFKAAKGRDGQS